MARMTMRAFVGNKALKRLTALVGNPQTTIEDCPQSSKWAILNQKFNLGCISLSSDPPLLFRATFSSSEKMKICVFLAQTFTLYNFNFLSTDTTLYFHFLSAAIIFLLQSQLSLFISAITFTFYICAAITFTFWMQPSLSLSIYSHQFHFLFRHHFHFLCSATLLIFSSV